MVGKLNTVVRLYNKTFSLFNDACFCDKITFTCIDRQTHVEREFKKQADREVDEGLHFKYGTYIHH